ncbi:MAG: hypothetical protein K9M55_07345 [Candidatus Marinimicrobia bacterium]|nr:hypothetical protein [Candidatus Neomarinimicrobiota bacterium]
MMTQQARLPEYDYDRSYSDFDWNPGKYCQARPAELYDFRILSLRDVVAELTGLIVNDDAMDVCPICSGTHCFQFVPNAEYFICYSCKNHGHVQRFVAAYKDISISNSISFLISKYFMPQHRNDVEANNLTGLDNGCAARNPQNPEEGKVQTNPKNETETPNKEEQYGLF